MKPRFVHLRGRGIPAQGRYSSVVKDRSPEGFGAGGELGSPRRSPPHAPSCLKARIFNPASRQKRPNSPCRHRSRPLFYWLKKNIVFSLFFVVCVSPATTSPRGNCIYCHRVKTNRVGEERLPSHTTKRAGFWHFAVSAAHRPRSTCSSVLLLSASALTPCAHISALHFAAFCRQVSAVSRFTFPARRMRD